MFVRNAFTYNCKRNTGRIFNQPIFQGLISVLSSKNKLPSTKTAICKVETLAERYILLDLLLFKLITSPGKETVLLAIPEICADKIIMLYHSSLFTGTSGCDKDISDYWR